jgi:hypothetical protein
MDDHEREAEKGYHESELLREQEHKGYGDDEGEREALLEEEEEEDEGDGSNG